MTLSGAAKPFAVGKPAPARGAGPTTACAWLAPDFSTGVAPSSWGIQMVPFSFGAKMGAG
jgi:hypothetical protein